MPVKHVPDDYRTATPYLTVDGADRAIAYYEAVFGAAERMRLPGPGGRVMHAEIKIGDSTVMLADACPGMGNPSPRALGGSPVTICLYVEDADATVARAVDAGATVVRPLEDRFYGDRVGVVADPFGHVWSIATHTEDVSPEEMRRRMGDLMAKASA